MANWKTKIRITDLHQAYDKKEITIKELAQKMKERCSENPYYQTSKLFEYIVNDFEGIEDVEDYDYVLRDLYDFGDYEHRIWIESIS